MSSNNNSVHHGDAAATGAHRELPDEKTLAEAGEIMIKDKDGGQLALKSLWSGKAQGEKQLIVFIRHFFCGVSVARARPLEARRRGCAATDGRGSGRRMLTPSPWPRPPELQAVRPGPRGGPPRGGPRGRRRAGRHRRLRRAGVHPPVRRGDRLPVPHLRRPEPAEPRGAGHGVQHEGVRDPARLHQDGLPAERRDLDVGRPRVRARAVRRAGRAERRGVAVRGRGAEVVPPDAERD